MRVIDTTNPVNWNNHLNHGLLGWWMDLPGWTPTNRMWDIVRPGLGGGEGTLTSMAVPGTSTSGWRAGINGFRALTFDGTNDSVLGSLTIPSTASGITIAMILLDPSVNDAGGFLFSWGERELCFITGFAAGDYEIYYDAGTFRGDLTTVATTDGKYHLLLATLDYTSNTVIPYYDGVQDSASIGSVTTSYSGTKQLRIGSDTNADNYWMAMTLLSFSAWGRALSPLEVKKYHQEWQQGFPNLLNHASNRRYVRVAAAGGFQPSWARGCNVVLGAGRA